MMAWAAMCSTALPERSMLPASKNSTSRMSAPAGGRSAIRSKPGIQEYFCESGWGMTTETSRPRARRASPNARLQPSVSPSASLWPRTMICWCWSHSSRSWSTSLRIAVMLTGSALSSIVTVCAGGPLVLPGVPTKSRWRGADFVGWVGGEDLPQRLRDAHRVLDRWIELEAQVGRELQVLQAPAELVPDQTRGAAQAGQRGAALLLPAQDADPHPRRTQVRRHADLGDAHEADPGVLQVPADDLHDLLPNLTAHLNGTVAAHQSRP